MRLTPEQLEKDLIDADGEFGSALAGRLELHIKAIETELASAREREQAIEAAAYRKAAVHYESELRRVDSSAVAAYLLSLITPSAQSALDEHDANLREQIITEGPQELLAKGWLPPVLVADREKRARETAIRETLDVALRYRHGPIKGIDMESAVMALLDAPGSPSPHFGDGDYSCAVCGMGMKEPCEHWKEAKSLKDVQVEQFKYQMEKP